MDPTKWLKPLVKGLERNLNHTDSTLLDSYKKCLLIRLLNGQIRVCVQKRRFLNNFSWKEHQKSIFIPDKFTNYVESPFQSTPSNPIKFIT